MRSIRKVVVLGANGAMGAGSAAVFALAGVPTVLLARTREKAEAGRARAEQLGKGRIGADALGCGTYDDLATALAGADLVLEAVAEDARTKRAIYSALDAARGPDAIVATVSSGLSIGELCAGLSPSFRSHFLGAHLFNPPTAIVGCELIAHAGTDPGVVAVVRDFLTSACGREVVECNDTPAFAGNRLGFKVLNEVAQLAVEHGVAPLDALLGPHTGRALSPLATIDLVGWDVHAAIVDNLYARTHDTAHAQFALPAYMRDLIARGHLGRKTRERGGFFRVVKAGAETRTFVLEPATGDYRPLAEMARPLPPFVDRMRAALRAGRRDAAMGVMAEAEGREAEVLRRVLLGYISYGLGLVGEVVARPRDIDRIMSFGFLWAPPGMLADALGAARTIALLEAARLPVPPVLAEAATHHRALCHEPKLDPARLFALPPEPARA